MEYIKVGFYYLLWFFNGYERVNCLNNIDI